MKTLALLAAVVITSPAASFADHCFPHVYSHWHGGYRPEYRPYGYCAPGPVISLTFGSRPSVYPATRYYVPAGSYAYGGSSLEASVQRALRREGYYSGPVDGDIGPQSRAAIREYQAENGLTVTGRIDARLLRSLGI